MHERALRAGGQQNPDRAVGRNVRVDLEFGEFATDQEVTERVVGVERRAHADFDDGDNNYANAITNR